LILPDPEAVNPVIVPAIQEAVQVKFDPATVEVRMIFVFEPEQMVLSNGLFVI